MDPIEVPAIGAYAILAIERLIIAEVIRQGAQAARQVLRIDPAVVGFATAGYLRILHRKERRGVTAPDNAIGHKIPLINKIAGRFDSRTPKREIR